MGVEVREKQKGSGVFWVFVDHQGRRRAIRAGKKIIARQIADQLRLKLLSDPGFIFDRRKAVP